MALAATGRAIAVVGTATRTGSVQRRLVFRPAATVALIPVAPACAATAFAVIPAKCVRTMSRAAQLLKCAARPAVLQTKTAAVAPAPSVVSTTTAPPVKAARAAPALACARLTAQARRVGMTAVAGAVGPAMPANVKPAQTVPVLVVVLRANTAAMVAAPSVVATATVPRPSPSAPTGSATAAEAVVSSLARRL